VHPTLLMELDQGRDMMEPRIGDDGIEPVEALDGSIDRSPIPVARHEIGGAVHRDRTRQAPRRQTEGESREVHPVR
jgi:hypothetical protein